MQRKKKFYIFIDIIILFMIGILYYAKNDIMDYRTEILKMGVIVISLFILFIAQLYRMKKNIMNYSIIFFVFLFLFNYGEVLLYTFGVSESQLLIFRVCTLEEVYNASYFFMFSMIFYHIGSLLAINPDKYDDFLIGKKPSVLFLKAIKIVGIILFIISVVPYNYILIDKLIKSLRYGYNYLYGGNSTSIPNLLGYIANFFVPSVFILLYCAKNKFGKITLTSLLLIISIMKLLIGGRGDAFTIIVILIVFNYNFVKKITRKQMIKIALIAVFIMLLIPIVGGVRSASNKNIGTFTEVIYEVVENKDNNFIVETIAELGGSMHPYILTRRIVPSVYRHKYGESYLASILMIIPSQLLGGYSFASKAALDIWLQDALKMSYGPGYSLFAETYYNFGTILGIIFASVLGFFFTRIFNVSSKNLDKYILLKLLSLIFLYNSLILGRFPFHSTIRNLVYLFIFPYFLIFIIYNKMRKDA